MLVVCSILLTINVGGVGVMGRYDVEGKLLKEDLYSDKYLVDFTQGIKKYNIVGQSKEYEKVIVNKSDCVRE